MCTHVDNCVVKKKLKKKKTHARAHKHMAAPADPDSFTNRGENVSRWQNMDVQDFITFHLNI